MLILALLGLSFLSDPLEGNTPFEPKTLRVVDGDTLKINGVSSRISNLDTPERGARAQCDAEKFLAAVATRRAEELIASGGVVIQPEGRLDRYRRPLVRINVQGQDWATIMVSESLAVPWAGRQHDWCA